MRNLAVLLLLTFTYCQGQASAGSGKAQTSGPCSPASSGSNNNFTIQCGIDKEQGQKMLGILNRILAKQLDPDLVMAKLDDIERDVKKLRNGSRSGYDFNGIWREETPGRTKAVVGDETTVFQNMSNLQTERQWKELLEVSEAQIKKTPTWLTPYLFSGIANANLGNRSAAVERLRFVHTEAAGNLDYADADRLLRLLQP